MWDRRERAERKQGSLDRILIILLIFGGLFAILVYQLWMLQIADGEGYTGEVAKKASKTIREASARGTIYDRNGQVLAANRIVYTITMTDMGEYEKERERQLALNGAIYKVMKKLEESQEPMEDGWKIEADGMEGYQYAVEGAALARFQADVFGKANPEELTEEQKAMDANEMMELLAGNDKFALYGEGKVGYSQEEREKYGLPAAYTQEEALKLVGCRYMLSLNAYQRYVPVVLARDVSMETVAYIKENSADLPGVEIGEEWERVYEGGQAFSHILGYVGKISKEELEELEQQGMDYTAESVVGKTGIEKYLEEELHGQDGEIGLVLDNRGRVAGKEILIREAACGQDVYLSIDKDLQESTYQILEQSLAGIVASNLINSKIFDKAHISDTTDIRIPIYDVYIALFENNVIRLEDFYSQDATKLEKGIREIWEGKCQEAVRDLKEDLLEGDKAYRSLSEEMQRYERYAVEESGILGEAGEEREDAFYERWSKGGEISTKELLMHGIEAGWIREGLIKAGQDYLTMEEMYGELVGEIESRLLESWEFKKLLFRRLILEDGISGQEIGRLLYDQSILPKKDPDYKPLLSGELDAFSFMKKKIEQLEITPAQLALDPCSASALVVQPGTGEVLACVSYPGYDNSRLSNQVDGEYYSQLLNDRSLPLYNRATQQLTAPGSTLKPVTVVAGLQEGVIGKDTAVICDGVFDKVMPSLRCWKHSGHGKVKDAPTALQFSCNDYLCEISYRLGMGKDGEYNDKKALERLQKYAKLFGLDEKSGMEIAESEPHITDAYGIPSAIGQGTHNYTTAQLARYVNIIASKGEKLPLSLLKGSQGGKGDAKGEEAVEEDRVQLPDAAWDAVWGGMAQFAQNNALLKDMKISVAGKTGTAQESKSRPDHALFVGYAPAEKPEAAVAVRIANGYGSSNATAVGRSIFNLYFGLESKESILTGKASHVSQIRSD